MGEKPVEYAPRGHDSKMITRRASINLDGYMCSRVRLDMKKSGPVPRFIDLQSILNRPRQSTFCLMMSEHALQPPKSINLIAAFLASGHPLDQMNLVGVITNRGNFSPHSRCTAPRTVLHDDEQHISYTELGERKGSPVYDLPSRESEFLRQHFRL
ncbi:hypothetical protein CCUS01_14037 [Colletotrichum cuscutae]|uniref:Uncharacterized protein n=1 Tax=Colletotrichum cuscutae TaxID=1209917 RepID=A0AAJ0DM16_9PEZI|nr:hypothetical protein CCUS01_14037 [Colletotrichum cuscutae]